MLKGCQVWGMVSPMYMPFFALHYWLQPCVPFAPGFWILEECSQYHANTWNTFTLSRIHGNTYWTCYCLLMLWSLRQMVENYFFVWYEITVLSSFCLRYYLNTLLSHLNTGSRRFGTLAKVRVYRKLQLMACFFNGFHQDMLISIFAALVGFCFVIPLFAFITAKDRMTIPQVFIFGSAILQVPMCIAIAFGTFGGIYADSIEALQAFRTENSTLETKMERKICAKSVRSLGPLKVMIGTVSFFDRLTPMTFIDFCINILVNLLLLQ